MVKFTIFKNIKTIKHMIKHLKHGIVIYNPGYAGNFLTRVFSIGNEVVMQLPKELLKQNQYPVDEKLALYSFSQIQSNYLNWQRFHRDWVDFYDYELLDTKFNNDECTHIMFSMHEPEFNKNLDKLTSIKNVKFFYVDLDLNKHADWLFKSQQDLNFKYRMDETANYLMLPNELPNLQHINLSKIIDSEEGFILEYKRICSVFGITEHVPEAVMLYRDWYSVRVQGKI